VSKIRLAKFIADAGFCSRRQASRLIDDKRVRVNGALANHIDHVDGDDHIELDGQQVVAQHNKHYFAIFKPIGIDCKLIPSDPSSLIHLLPQHIRLFPIGRLDKDSHGLLLLTNDGELCHQLNHPNFDKEKEYIVTTSKPISHEFCQQMMAGVPVKGEITRPCIVEQLNETQFRIILTQGLNRQIRRMTKFCGNYVTDLKRVRIAKLTLAELNLEPGKYCAICRSQITS
jgi:16S rRNA pseudouridine516 synthase